MLPSPNSYRAVVHSPPDTVDDAHDFLATIWEQRPDIDAGERVAIETALSELVTNVIQNNPHRPVFCEVTLIVTPEELLLRTADTGDPLPATPAPSMPDTDAEHGRCLALIELITDGLDYHHEDSVNVWQVTKHRRS